MDILIESNVAEVTAEIKAKLPAETARALLSAANMAGGMIAQEVTAEFAGGKGNLARSFLPARLVKTEHGIGAAALSDLPYAGIQNRGGEVTPRKPGGYLAIPLSRGESRWPRDWASGDLFPWMNKKTGNLFLARTNGKKLDLQYLLRKSVTIDPTRYIERAADRSRVPAAGILDDGIQIAIVDAERSA